MFELPGWVEIRREGAELIGLSSADGETWTEVLRLEVALPEIVLVGTVLSGRDLDPESSFVAARARFSQIELGSTGPVGTPFARGDSNDDGMVDLSDAINTLGVLFLGEGKIACEDASDANDDGIMDLSDAINTLGALFLGDTTIPSPGREDCGDDPTDDELECDEYLSCE
jgi:hypothetical protein